MPTPTQNLSNETTRQIYAALELPYLSERHDAIKELKAQWERETEIRNQQAILEAHIEELELTLEMKGKILLQGQLIDDARIEGDSKVIYPSPLEARLESLKAQRTSPKNGDDHGQRT